MSVDLVEGLALLSGLKSRAGPKRAQVIGLAGAALAAFTGAAAALVVELKDIAPDRIERHPAEAIGQIPLPNTPNVARLAERLAERGLASGNAVMIRVFKAESELELWMQKGDRFELFATYPVCHWSGTLGPKINEGDKQSPEGIYTLTSRQLHLIGRHPRSLNLGFPNALDKQFQRTGSYILIHGGCGSVGCFAMTNPVIEEIFSLTQAAIKSGQDTVQVHAFPFRMTEEKLQTFALNEWYDFWRNLKDVYDSFERTKRPPKISVCEGRYWAEDTLAPGEVAARGPLAVCGSLAAVASPNSETDNASTTSLPSWSPMAMSFSPPPHPSVTYQSPVSRTPSNSYPFPLSESLRQALLQRDASSQNALKRSLLASRNPDEWSGPARSAQSLPASSTTTRPGQNFCDATRPSCRKWLDLRRVMAEKAQAAERQTASRTFRLATARR